MCVTKKRSVNQKYAFIIKNKNPNFLHNHYSTQNYLILTYFHNDLVKFLDFSKKAYF